MTKRLTADDVWQSNEIMSVNALLQLGIHDLMPLVHAIESAVLARSKSDSGQAEPVALDVTLDDEAAKLLRDMLTSPWAGDDDATPIRLLTGNGHSGYGLYVAAAEYQDEGAVLLHELTAPQAVNQRLLEAAEYVVDVVDDYTNNAPEHRCYVPEASNDSMEKLRAAITAAERGEA